MADTVAVSYGGVTLRAAVVTTVPSGGTGSQTSANSTSVTPASDATFTTQVAALAAGTDRSGSAATTSAQIIAANSSRRGLEIQNIGANNIGINEFAGTAAIGTAGTYTLVPGASMRIRTNRAITAIAATGATAFTATEW